MPSCTTTIKYLKKNYANSFQFLPNFQKNWRSKNLKHILKVRISLIPNADKDNTRNLYTNILMNINEKIIKNISKLNSITWYITPWSNGIIPWDIRMFKYIFSWEVVYNSCEPTDCSSPGSFDREILQARILARVATPSSGDFPNPRIKPGSPTL